VDGERRVEDARDAAEGYLRSEEGRHVFQRCEG